MLTTIKIPVIDTESGKYKYEGKLSREEYDRMVMDNFNATNARMNRFVDNIRDGISNVRRRGMYDVVSDENILETQYDYYEAEAFIQDAKKNDIKDSFFDEHFDKKDMFILILNINPNSLDGDAESELRFWLDDSGRVHKDISLDSRTKMKALPMRDISILLHDADGNEMTGKMEGCKILQNYSDKKYPFHFAIIVEKIVY